MELEPNVAIVHKLMENLSTEDSSVAADGDGEQEREQEQEQPRPKTITNRIAIDKRENEKEKFIKIAETRSSQSGGQRSRIILSLESAKELSKTVQELSKFLVPDSDEAKELQKKPGVERERQEESDGEGDADESDKVPQRRVKDEEKDEDENVDEHGKEAVPLDHQKDEDNEKKGEGQQRIGGGRRRSRENPNLLKRVRIDGIEDELRKYNVDVLKTHTDALYIKVSQTSARQRLRQRSIVLLPNLKAAQEFVTALNEVLESHSVGDKALLVITEELATDKVHFNGRGGGGRRAVLRAEGEPITTPQQLEHAKQLGNKFIPGNRSFRSINQNKNFYCDFSENPRGVRMRITEVTSQMRSYVTVPLRCWPMLRDILVSTCEQAEVAGHFQTRPRNDRARGNRKPRVRGQRGGSREKNDSESTLVVEGEEDKDKTQDAEQEGADADIKVEA